MRKRLAQSDGQTPKIVYDGKVYMCVVGTERKNYTHFGRYTSFRCQLYCFITARDAMCCVVYERVYVVVYSLILWVCRIAKGLRILLWSRKIVPILLLNMAYDLRFCQHENLLLNYYFECIPRTIAFVWRHKMFRWKCTGIYDAKLWIVVPVLCLRAPGYDSSK